MHQLPLEIQSIIRDEMPTFSRLSHIHVAGKHIIEKLCNKDIGKLEFLNYIYLYEPDYFIIYMEENDNYYVLEGIKYNNNYYNKNAYYNIIPYSVKINNESLYTKRITMKKEGGQHLLIDDLHDYIMNLGNLYYDILTTYTIYKHLRKECNYLDDKFYIKTQFNKHIINEGNTDFDMLYNQLKICMYLVSNDMIIKNHLDFIIFVIPNQDLINHLIFDKNNTYIGDNIDFINVQDFLDEIYDMTIEDVENFI